MSTLPKKLNTPVTPTTVITLTAKVSAVIVTRRRPRRRLSAIRLPLAFHNRASGTRSTCPTPPTTAGASNSSAPSQGTASKKGMA